MKRFIPQKRRQRGCEFFRQDHEGHWHCGLLEFSGQPYAILTPRGRIKWVTTSAHELLLRYWPGRTDVENRLPSQIDKWVTRCRKQRGAKGTAPTTLTPLTINRPFSCVTVRHMHDGICSALLFEEFLSEVPADRLISLGLTPREAEVLRWLVRGKSSFEIAEILNIRGPTVSKHLGRIYRQLGVENRHAAVAMMHDELRRIAPQR